MSASQFPDASIEKAAALISGYAEGLGFSTIPQFYAITALLMPDHSETAIAVGPLRYTIGRAMRDMQGYPGKATVVFVVRFYGDDDSQKLTEHRAERQREIDGDGA